MKAKLEAAFVKNLMFENTSSLQPPRNMAFKKIFFEVSLEDSLEKHWERDNMGSSGDPTNLKRVKISTLISMV